MAAWLLKTEPTTYSWDDLVRAGRGGWDGVANALAQQHLRAMQPGDRAVIYHTGAERRAVGLAEIVSAPYPEPAGDGKRVMVDLVPHKPLVQPVGLDVFKATPAFAGSALVRLGRLSVVPLSATELAALLALARTRG
ncbi:MAG: EVE domain-containing protein [Myxococcales bacterium]|nr:EVE domain-containing protein [Myxococcales bacterium]